jgi:hypothetical protein
MSPKITPDHLGRAAVVYVRQSTMAQVTGNLESQRRQYDLAKAAEAAGFASVTVIDDDLGRSGSGAIQRALALSGWSQWCAPAMSAQCFASRRHAWRATGGIGIISSICARLPARWLSIRMAPMIHESSTIACCLG